MTKDEARSSIMSAISMALKDTTLQQGFEIICKENAELQEENKKWIDEWQAQVQKANDEGYARTLQTIQLNKAKEIIRRLMDIINHDLKCFDTMAGLDVKQKAEQFLKETKDIREDSTYKGYWVVDEH